MLGSSAVGVDPVIGLIVLASVAALVLGIGLGATALAARAPRRDRLSGRLVAVPALPSPAGMAGLSWLAPRGAQGRAQVAGVVVGVGIAVGAAIASASVVTSLRQLTAEPIRYGAPWHATISSALGEGSVRGTANFLTGLDGVEAVGRLIGNDGSIGDHIMSVYGVAPVPNLPSGIEPVVTSGRLPTAR
jgi:hypothetical protein